MQCRQTRKLKEWFGGKLPKKSDFSQKLQNLIGIEMEILQPCHNYAWVSIRNNILNETNRLGLTNILGILISFWIVSNWFKNYVYKILT